MRIRVSAVGNVLFNYVSEEKQALVNYNNLLLNMCTVQYIRID